jgi:hypothetical protein
MVHAPSPLLLTSCRFARFRPLGFPFDLDCPLGFSADTKVNSRKLEAYGSLQPHLPTMSRIAFKNTWVRSGQKPTMKSSA